VNAAVVARKALAAMLRDGGVDATLDAGAFYPQPVGVLVGLPSLVDRTLAGAIFTCPVLVVSGDPLSTLLAVDRLYALADECAGLLSLSTYEPASYSTSANAEPLPAIALTVTLTATESEEPNDGATH
jgi:hypothetical protein